VVLNGKPEPVYKLIISPREQQGWLPILQMIGEKTKAPFPIFKVQCTWVFGWVQYTRGLPHQVPV